MPASPESGTCPSCRSTVRFVSDGRSGNACPVCGAVQRLADEAAELLTRPRAARRVVDVDSGGAHGRKSSAASRTPPRTSPTIRRDGGARSVTGALDGTGGGGRVTPAGPSDASGTRAADPGPRGAMSARWQALTDGLRARDGRPWRESSSYEPGEILLHTRHGMGVIERVGDDGSLDVLFRSGYQRLPAAARACAPEPSPSP